MSTYRQADHAQLTVLREVLEEYHPDLVEAGVTVRLMLAFAKRGKDGQPTGAALKLRGRECLGLASINNHEQRVAGLPDCTIKLDGDDLPNWTLQKLRYVLDHEATHYEVIRDDSGEVQLDDSFRPKLKMRLHDADVGIFFDVVARHEEVAVEAQAAVDVFRKLQQMDFDFGDAAEAAAVPKLAAV